MVELGDKGLMHWNTSVSKTTGKDVANLPGAGAAGGVGAACMAFLNAKNRSGIDFILDCFQIDKYLPYTNLIITGEGSLDHQSFSGKVIDGLYKKSEKYATPILVMAGNISLTYLPNRVTACCITPSEMSLSDAMCKKQAKEN